MKNFLRSVSFLFLPSSSGPALVLTKTSERSRRLLRRAACGFSLTALALACSDIPEIAVDDDGSDADGQDVGDDGVIVDGGFGGGTGGQPGPLPYTCGDGTLEPGEFCDDGNTNGDDGCSADCLVQNPDYDCSIEGEPCVLTVICGNGVIEGKEACDDGNERWGRLRWKLQGSPNRVYLHTAWSALRRQPRVRKRQSRARRRMRQWQPD